MTCIGFALGLAYLTCTQSVAAPTGRLPFCETMRQTIAGGKIRPSRSDTRKTKEDADAINAVYDRNCR